MLNSKLVCFFSQAYKTKNITITRYHCIFPLPGKNGKDLKQSVIEVKMIINVKKLNLCSNIGK